MYKRILGVLKEKHPCTTVFNGNAQKYKLGLSTSMENFLYALILRPESMPCIGLLVQTVLSFSIWQIKFKLSKAEFGIELV
jgi:hypothetical protein